MNNLKTPGEAILLAVAKRVIILQNNYYLCGDLHNNEVLPSTRGSTITQRQKSDAKRLIFRQTRTPTPFSFATLVHWGETNNTKNNEAVPSLYCFLLF